MDLTFVLDRLMWVSFKLSAGLFRMFLEKAAKSACFSVNYTFAVGLAAFSRMISFKIKITGNKL